MRKMYAVDNMQDYLAQIDDVVFDLEEMVACSTEDEGEELAGVAPHCQEIADCLKSVRHEIAAGTRLLGSDRDLECMPLIRELRRALPFYPLLDAINTTYMKGFGEN